MDNNNVDIELVRRLQTGDVEAFDLIYENYSGKLYLFALKYLRSKVDAEELVQSVFIKVWEHHKSLRKEASFKSFLFTIAYNDICKLFRKRSNLQKLINETISSGTEPSFGIEEGIEYQSVLDRIQQVINKLPERQKSIFLKSRMEGKSTKEIADELKLSPGTVDNYISESLKFIKRRIQGEDLSLLLFFSLCLL